MWNIVTAKCTGTSHLKNNEPSQDSYFIEEIKGWYAVTVCDGAGSSKYGGEAAEIFSSKFTQKLLSIGQKITEKSIVNLGDEVSKAILEIREHLISKTKIPTLKDWQCTLVAVLLDKDGNGFTVHVGDGIAFTATHNEHKLTIRHVSPPENGEYANETFFVTGSSWYRHLRIQLFRQVNFISLSTDGAASLFWDEKSKQEDNQGIHLKFWNPVFDTIYSANNTEERNHYLTNLINSKAAQKNSDDDKTLVIIFNDSRNRNEDQGIEKSNKKILKNNQPETEITTVNHFINQELKTKSDNQQISERSNRVLMFITLIIVIVILFGIALYLNLLPQFIISVS